MEAKTLKKKKVTVNKGKLKKTIKNVLCRPDPVFWPVVSMSDVNRLESALSKYKVPVPEFKKPHWDKIKHIPKEKRPKPPTLEKVDGLIFGISECLSSIQKRECSVIIIDSNVNPQTIVQPTLEACIEADLPVVCINNLRKTSSAYFGITTSCLGVKSSCLLELRDEISEVAKKYRPPLRKCDVLEPIDVDNINNKEVTDESLTKEINNITECPYLYRTSKKTRVFVPNEGISTKLTKSFIGQDFIEFSSKPKVNNERKAYMNMILKRVTNNPNRVKSK
ncbi:hypothetical protein K1T71_009666 [Dendrolimus kikuchii]|uniref:Uncharacterized protein n=1 Tax=Dendrolimus kikuchii TaxID=765133 RepID=A0ACC1CSF8_9NEOP|nr:hypothetical protein K1T71_009666 [Dendrolimus kikuchii]